MKKALLTVLLSFLMCFSQYRNNPLYAASEGRNVGDAIGAVLGLPSGSFEEGMKQIERARLKGVESVYLTIENMSSSAQALGINENLISTAVEIQLRKAGIKVVQRGSLVMFYVNVHVLKPINGIYAVNVVVSVKDMVTLLRDPKITFQTEIWSGAILGASGELKVKEAVKEAVGNLVDNFVLDYLRAKQD